uniref:Sleeping Beauty transposase HTH domain-containing protein n=1 Tax=Amphiprion percula TaxID=161767 RepID=A0A3P8S2U9_AMPPE
VYSKNHYNKIVVLHRSGNRFKTIAKALSVPRSAVVSIVLKRKKLGATRTHPRFCTNQERMDLVSTVSKNPAVTTTEITVALQRQENLLVGDHSSHAFIVRCREESHS